MKKTILAALLAAPLFAHAQSMPWDNWFQFEAGVGASHYTPYTDGLWYQQGLPHSLQVNALAAEVGVVKNVWQSGNWGVDLHLDYAYLGQINYNAMATPSDANYNTQTKGCNGQCWPLSNFVGSGHDQGVYLTVEPHYDWQGFRFGVEAGPYIHHLSWSETVYGWEPSANGPRMNLYGIHDSEWNIGAVGGVSVEKKNFSVNYQFFYNPSHHSASVPAPWGFTQTVMLKYKF